MREDLRVRLDRVRRQTLDLLNNLEDADLARQAHLDWSPIGWHLGHIAYTEAYWLLARCAGDERLASRYGGRFVTTEVPKDLRSAILPCRAELEAYLREVRTASLAALDRFGFEDDHPLLRGGAIVHMVIQHEAQHLENIAIVTGLLGLQKEAAPTCPASRVGSLERDRMMVRVPGGRFELGATRAIERCYDNERDAHAVEVGDFRIDRLPVTNRRYLAFVDARGYREKSLWSENGRRWLDASGAAAPFGWQRTEGAWRRRGLSTIAPLVPDEPVCGVSWFEADAFARFEGRRLPTEAEWERAATFDPAGGKRMHAWGDGPPGRPHANHDLAVGGPTPVGAHPSGASRLGCQDLHGNVWEWTSSVFAPYPGFAPFAYEGYSMPYFDGVHRVLRGGSFATSPEVLRATFRNWYAPHVREIFAGLRCAADGAG